ncbi:MAG: TIGR04283 family arsenosugar biosynthesis glycosyltransferase [Desulfobacteraceae bacterium]|nr:TIGR04283 family arsenosugar biosynthesis glycosyltransferase [Desulfobacteraceae bacterium]
MSCQGEPSGGAEEPRWSGPASISVIIPALNEAARLGRTLATTKAEGVEVIVADGGSRDATPRIAARQGAQVIASPPGRARQMNAGASAAGGEILLFLHADTLLPAGFAEEARRLLAVPAVAAGAFRLSIRGGGWGLRLVEKAANWRAKKLWLPYGDQALFLRAELFRELGGFPELPVMEDVALVRTLRRRGRIAIAPLTAATSGRRWRERGIFRVTLVHQAMLLGYLLHRPPDQLARWHQGGHGFRNGRLPGNEPLPQVGIVDEDDDGL